MPRGLATLIGLADPPREKDHIPRNRRNVDVVRFISAPDLVEILAPRIRLRRLPRHEQLPKLFDGIRGVLARIFDPDSFVELNLHILVPFLLNIR